MQDERRRSLSKDNSATIIAELANVISELNNVHQLLEAHKVIHEFLSCEISKCNVTNWSFWILSSVLLRTTKRSRWNSRWQTYGEVFHSHHRLRCPITCTGREGWRKKERSLSFSSWTKGWCTSFYFSTLSKTTDFRKKLSQHSPSQFFLLYEDIYSLP